MIIRFMPHLFKCSPPRLGGICVVCLLVVNRVVIGRTVVKGKEITFME